MWEARYEQVFDGVTKEAIWNAWVDVNNWSKWDLELEYAKIDGPFKKDSQFILKPKGAPKVKITLTEVTPLVRFSDVTQFPLARMTDTHELEETAQGLKIKSKITIGGPLAWLWQRIVAQGVANGVPAQVESLVNYAKKS